ncbi:hypothetical protein EMCG_00684, partial [[Emmonsia] crescens]
MRLKLAKLQSINQTPDLPASQVLHGQAAEYDSDSLIDNKITFLRTAKLVLKLINLSGSGNYLVWRESIFSCVETAKCHLILNNEEEGSPFDELQDTTIFWSAK